MKPSTAIMAAMAATLALGGMTLSADARQGRGGEGVAFERLDVNGDGVLSLADAEAAMAERFATIDTDGNGSISPEEFANQRQAAQSARAESVVESLDTDGNGELSPEELAAGRPEAREGGRDGKKMARGGGRGGNPMERLERLIERFDTDGDSALSEAEFDAAVAEMKERRGGPRGEKRGG